MIPFFSRAPEFKDIDGWINSKPLTIESLKGKVVLLDFWTYSSVNCLRTLPALKTLWDTYRKSNVVIIGIHTPEFDFEQNPENVKQAVKRLGIPYPVALDSKNTTWKLYGNRYWPRQTLLDHKGKLIYEHHGEGDYEEIEEHLKKAISQTGIEVPALHVRPRKREIHFDISPKIFAGTARNTGLGSSAVQTSTGSKYTAPKKLTLNTIYPQGDWVQKQYYLVHTGYKEGFVTLQCRGKEINAILSPLNSPGKVHVLLNGKAIPRPYAGRDIKYNTKGESSLHVTEPRLYNLFATKKPQTHEITLTTEEGIAIYAYTFG